MNPVATGRTCAHMKVRMHATCGDKIVIVDVLTVRCHFSVVTSVITRARRTTRTISHNGEIWTLNYIWHINSHKSSFLRSRNKIETSTQLPRMPGGY
jgi:hypothetical protein